MEARSDGQPFETEAVVNADNCVSCGICAGACPTATPFRRAGELVPGIQLPDHAIASLRERTLNVAHTLDGDHRVLVFACGHAGAEPLRDSGVGVVTMPCIGMLPPSFIDFALSRKLADGVMLAGCAAGDCHFRLGDEWVRQRVAGNRDPYLRKRVPRDRLRLSWLGRDRLRRRRLELADFRLVLRQQTVDRDAMAESDE
jgi:coenzyme F420-reducing hydrogenase delta subunit